ncbi:MAG: PLP-dependent aminotransferase family protein, partial [Firmicutes bacterium]|nr:PLP-dependent aminotransferase family protein [Bacillota bacterium]
REELKKRRDFTLDILNEYYSDLAVWDKPEGSYYVWLKLKGNISTKKIFETALKENLLINPGEMYDFAENRCIRISYAYETMDKLKDGLIRLADIIRSM